MKQYLFRNDYSFGAHPKVLEALAATNLEGNPAMGTTPTAPGPLALSAGCAPPTPRWSSSPAAPR